MSNVWVSLDRANQVRWQTLKLQRIVTLPSCLASPEYSFSSASLLHKYVGCDEITARAPSLLPSSMSVAEFSIVALIETRKLAFKPQERYATAG